MHRLRLRYLNHLIKTSSQSPNACDGLKVSEEISSYFDNFCFRSKLVSLQS